MKSILFTGANGYLGKNVIPLLNEQYTVTTLDIHGADINANISKNIPIIDNKKNDIIIHAAGKAHFIPKTKEDKQSFFDINYQGTINLCKALEKFNVIPTSFIFISTVAVYGCDSGENITEEHPLNGDTPYALSKIEAEKYLTDWCKKNNVILSIIRPSLIAGPNPPGNLGDMITGIKTGKYFNIAGGSAKKSILMIYDIVNLIPLLEKKGGIYNVCDDEHPTFKQLAELIAKQLGKKKPFNIPYWLANFFAIAGNFFGEKAPINSLKLKKINKSLTFSNEKIKKNFDWKPLNVLENFKIK